MAVSTAPLIIQTGPRKCSEYKHFYKEALENASNYNSKLIGERKLRLPYIDSHTGVAQNNCHIWFERHQRGPGLDPGQLYTYPARRWRKRPKTSQAGILRLSESKPALELQNIEHEPETSNDMSYLQDVDSHTDLYSTVSQDSNQSYADLYFKDFDPQDDFRDAGEIDRADSESDEDFEISYKKKKTKGKGRGGGRRRGAASLDPEYGPLTEKEEKPYPCKYPKKKAAKAAKDCGKRYKNRQGLSYHTLHHHHEEEQEEEGTPPPPAPPIEPPAAKSEGSADPNNYCDFCLGDANENKKTGTQEELISCADCGRSGHPSCLQFTDVMISKVKNYKWQCIECKSCGLCGTSDNDDQLLFCDDCDRGYHMYCLKPPMSQPPEGSWVCDLCKKDGRYTLDTL